MDVKPKIVVVDDVPTIGELLVRFLSKKNYEVSSFTNGKNALEYLKQKQVDVVLTDMHMPEMNGLELIKGIKIIRQDLPIILMSSYVDQDILDDLTAEGICDYVKTPFDLTALEQTIAKAIKK